MVTSDSRVDRHTEPPVNEFDPHHPHEPEIAPVFDSEGRCLVCGCQYRDQLIAERDARIDEMIRYLRALDPDCALLPENTEENEGWEREAHEFITPIEAMRVARVAYLIDVLAWPGAKRVPSEPGVDMSQPDDHGIVRHLP